jgi:RNA polymerase sigma-70 factor (ECF subfamily)
MNRRMMPETLKWTMAEMNNPGDSLAQVMLTAFSQVWTSVEASGEIVRPPVPAGVGPVLVGMFTAGREKWPDLTVDATTLATQIARLVGSDTLDLLGALATMSGADLYLATACAAQVPGALETFGRVCSVAINGTIASIDRTPTFRSDVRQALHDRLFVGSPEDPPRIESYAGRGPLSAWVAIVTQRLALLMRRTTQNRMRIEDRAANEALLESDDPELAFLKQRYQGEFKSAYRAALDALSNQDRTLLRLNLIDGITLDRLGTMFGVNPSTVSRWIGKARVAIRDATQEHLREHLRISNDEFASLARLVVSQLDVSIVALLEESRSTL